MYVKCGNVPLTKRHNEKRKKLHDKNRKGVLLWKPNMEKVHNESKVALISNFIGSIYVKKLIWMLAFFSSELLRFSFSWYYFFPTSHISFKYSNWICRNIFCSFQSKKIWPTKFLFLVGMNGSVFFAIPNFLSSRNAWYSKVSVESMLYLCTYISYWNMIFISCLSNIQNMQ